MSWVIYIGSQCESWMWTFTSAQPSIHSKPLYVSLVAHTQINQPTFLLLGTERIIHCWHGDWPKSLVLTVDFWIILKRTIDFSKIFELRIFRNSVIKLNILFNFIQLHCLVITWLKRAIRLIILDTILVYIILKVLKINIILIIL